MGNRRGYRRPETKPEYRRRSPLQFEHRDTAGNVVRWSTEIASCDKPSLAGNVTYCGMNSRVSRRVAGSVEWVSLCRKSSPHLEIDPEPYWQKENPTFTRLGIIGFNRQSGEIVFFDGGKDRHDFNWTQIFTSGWPFVCRRQRSRGSRQALRPDIPNPVFRMPRQQEPLWQSSPISARPGLDIMAEQTAKGPLRFSLGDYIKDDARRTIAISCHRFGVYRNLCR